MTARIQSEPGTPTFLRYAPALLLKEARHHTCVFAVFVGLAFVVPCLLWIGSTLSRDPVGLHARITPLAEVVLVMVAPLLSVVAVFGREMEDRTNRIVAAFPIKPSRVWLVKLASSVAFTAVSISSVFLFFTIFFGPPTAEGRGGFSEFSEMAGLFIQDSPGQLWKGQLLFIPLFAFATAAFVVQVVRQTMLAVLVSYVGSLLVPIGLAVLPWELFPHASALSWIRTASLAYIILALCTSLVIFRHGRGHMVFARDKILGLLALFALAPTLLLLAHIKEAWDISRIPWKIGDYQCSPDGRWIAFESYRKDDFGEWGENIDLFDYRNKTKKSITPPISYSYFWWFVNADGYYLYFRSPRFNEEETSLPKGFARYDVESERMESWVCSKEWGGPYYSKGLGTFFVNGESGARNIIIYSFGGVNRREIAVPPDLPQKGKGWHWRGRRYWSYYSLHPKEYGDLRLVILDIESFQGKSITIPEVSRGHGRSYSSSGRWLAVNRTWRFSPSVIWRRAERSGPRPIKDLTDTLVDFETGATYTLIPPGGDFMVGLIYSNNEARALAIYGKSMILLNLENGLKNRVPVLHPSLSKQWESPDEYPNVSFSPDGARIAVLGNIVNQDSSTEYLGIYFFTGNPENLEVTTYRLPVALWKGRSTRIYYITRWRTPDHFLIKGKPMKEKGNSNYKNEIWEYNVRTGEMKRLIPVN